MELALSTIAGGRSQEATLPRLAVVVLAMQGAGRRATLRMLGRLGCDLPASAGGEAEAEAERPAAIFALNDAILASAGSVRDDWFEFNPNWMESPRAAEFLERAVPLIDAAFGRSRLFALADPSICRLFPFWQEALRRAEARTVVWMPLRSPLDVAGCLGRKSGLDPAIVHLIWLRNVLEAEAASRGRARVICAADQLADGWGPMVQEAQDVFEVKWPRLSATAGREIEALFAARVSAGSSPREAVTENPLLSGWLRETFGVLDDWARGGERSADYQTLDRIRAEFNAAAPAFGRLVLAAQAGAQATAALERKLAEAQAQQTEANRAAALTEAGLSEARIEAEQRAAEAVTALARERTAAAEQAGAAEARMRTAEAEAERVKQDLAAQLQKAHGEKAVVERRLKERFDEIATLTRLLQDAEMARGVGGQELGRIILQLLKAATLPVVPGRLRQKWQVGVLKRSGVIDADRYRRANPDVAADGGDPLMHYFLTGAREGRDLGDAPRR